MRELGIPDDAPVVVCTARMVRRKGQDTLVRAWSAVLKCFPDARLLLIGDGPNRTRIERLVRRVGVQESVLLVGSVPWNEVPAYTDAGNVFAMPCRTRLLGLEPEAFGIVFLEARACGLPVLTGDSGGAGEAAGAEADVVDGDDPVQVGDRLVRLLEVGKTRDAEPPEDWNHAVSRLVRCLEAKV